jgi:hypothetical protein
MYRTNRIWLTLMASALAWLSLVASGVVRAGNSPPISDSWNIASSGKAASSGELLFRLTPQKGAGPVEISVFVLSGANETGVASSIRRALSNQLGNQFDIGGGEGANVLVTGNRRVGGFSLELIDSDVENVRVLVQSVTAVPPPTAPQQASPAIPSVTPATPAAPGDTAPPADAGPQAPPPGPAPATPSAPPAQSSAPPATPSAPPATPAAPADAPDTANGGAGAPASAPPPPPGTSH